MRTIYAVIYSHGYHFSQFRKSASTFALALALRPFGLIKRTEPPGNLNFFSMTRCAEATVALLRIALKRIGFDFRFFFIAYPYVMPNKSSADTRSNACFN